jgi:hypothetical protein
MVRHTVSVRLLALNVAYLSAGQTAADRGLFNALAGKSSGTMSRNDKRMSPGTKAIRISLPG